MANNSDSSVQYFIKSLASNSDDLAPAMKKLFDAPNQFTIRDLVELREDLVDIRVNIELLNESNDELQEEKKTKRRFRLFKK